MSRLFVFLSSLCIIKDNYSFLSLTQTDNLIDKQIDYTFYSFLDDDDSPTMNNNHNLSSQNASNRRTYYRRFRKGNNTSAYSLPITTATTILNTNNTLLTESTPVPINDLLAWISSLTQHKYILGIILSLFVLLCVASIFFIIFLSKCSRKKRWKNRRQKDLDDLPDFLDDHHKGENVILLEPTAGTSSVQNAITTYGNLPNDNISNTFSLDPMLEQKIIRNNPPNAFILSPMADDTSIDTLRGSLISSPSQQISAIQPPLTPTHSLPLTTTDSFIKPDERAVEAEKDDDLHDLDLPRILPRYTKTVNNSSSNLSGHRTSTSSIEQSIRKQERRAEQAERDFLHGSNSNIYEKEIRKNADRDTTGKPTHTNSQVSLVSRTSEDSCY